MVELWEEKRFRGVRGDAEGAEKSCTWYALGGWAEVDVLRLSLSDRLRMTNFLVCSVDGEFAGGSDAPGFGDAYALVGGDVGELVELAAGPVDFEGVGLGVLGEAEG